MLTSATILWCTVFYATFSLAASQRCNYKNPTHTMCLYKARACPGKQLIRSGGVTKAYQEYIVDLHNQLRGWVAGGYQKGYPAAVNMRALTWDNELASIAQRWADQCTSGHDKNRDVRQYPVGQNVAATWSFDEEDNLLDEPDWGSQIYAWYEECTNGGFKASYINPFRFSKSWGHFSQIAWAETTKIGCGYSYFRQDGRGLTKLYVCNYGPGGNVIGGSMYEKVKRAVCKDGFRQSLNTYLGLCDKDPDYVERTTR
ncbi:venom allergen 3-like [Ornithodoros turicata]|uniref:venom allergen 3-like n=1 Tax=Ornithodoros turicata TaxID=34597 RepID=UPI0031398465